MSEEKPKIIIDEDWKAKVQREREEAKKAAQEANKAQPTEEGVSGPPQEASFALLITGLATQAMLALGALAPQDAKEITVDIGQAKYLVDTLMMLRAKTQGNLTPEEEGTLARTLSDLQRVYVLRVQQAQESALRGSGVDPQVPGA